MNVPQTLPQALVFVAMLLPGFSYATVRTWFVGWRSPDNGAASRLLEALAASAVFLVVYVAAAAVFANGLSKVEAWTTARVADTPAWWAAVAIVVLLLVLPGLAAWGMSARSLRLPVRYAGATKVFRVMATRNQPIPRAWDMMAYSAVTPRFVRVKLENGEFFGGWYGADSYISTYPHDRDLFIEAQWYVSPEGELISEVEDSLGCWVPITDGCVVEWLMPPVDEESDASAEPSRRQRFADWVYKRIMTEKLKHNERSAG